MSYVLLSTTVGLGFWPVLYPHFMGFAYELLRIAYAKFKKLIFFFVRYMIPCVSWCLHTIDYSSATSVPLCEPLIDSVPHGGCLVAADITLFIVIMLGMLWVCMSFVLKEKHCICFWEFYGYAMQTYYSIYPSMIINLVLV